MQPCCSFHPAISLRLWTSTRRAIRIVLLEAATTVRTAEGADGAEAAMAEDRAGAADAAAEIFANRADRRKVLLPNLKL